MTLEKYLMFNRNNFLYIKQSKFPGVETEEGFILLIHFMHLPSMSMSAEFIFQLISVHIKKNVKPWVYILNQAFQFFLRSTAQNKMRKILHKFFRHC